MSENTSLGEDIRALRRFRSLTLEDLAGRLERSVGWLSQVERDLSVPRMADLRRIAEVLDVPLSLFFGSTEAPERERGRIVRANARRVIGERDNGLYETLVSPDLTDRFEIIHSTFQPGSQCEGPLSRPTQEVAYLLSGRLDIWLDQEAFTLDVGDSFRIRAQSFRWANPYDTPAAAIWVISPPVY